MLVTPKDSGISSSSEAQPHQHPQHGQQSREVKGTAQQENLDTAAITEMWWDGWHSWSAQGVPRSSAEGIAELVGDVLLAGCLGTAVTK